MLNLFTLYTTTSYNFTEFFKILFLKRFSAQKPKPYLTEFMNKKFEIVSVCASRPEHEDLDENPNFLKYSYPTSPISRKRVTVKYTS